MVCKTKEIDMAEPKTLSAAEAVVGQIARTMLELEEISVIQERELSTIREHYRDKIADLNAFVDTAILSVRGWAEKNSELFGNKKSMEFTHATIGFRTGTPKLKLKSRMTWDKVFEAMKTAPGAKDYLKIEEVIDRAGLISDREETHTQELLMELGIKVVQDETFYVDPKREDVLESTVVERTKK